MIFQACCKQVTGKLQASYPQLTLNLPSSWRKVGGKLETPKKLQESCMTNPNVRKNPKCSKEKGCLELNKFQLYVNVNKWNVWNKKALLLLDSEFIEFVILLLKSCKKVAKPGRTSSRAVCYFRRVTRCNRRVSSPPAGRSGGSAPPHPWGATRTGSPCPPRHPAPRKC